MKNGCMPLIFLFLIVTGAAQAAMPSYDVYGSWLIACDNILTCEAKGFVQGDDDVTSTMPDDRPINGSVDLRFIRDAGPDGVIEARLAAGFPFGLADLRVDGRPLLLDRSAWALNTRDGITILSGKRPEVVTAFVAQLRNGTMLQVRDGIVPLNGLSAAMLHMDDRQGRLDGVTALIRTGTKSASAVPPAPLLPPAPSAHRSIVLARRERARLMAWTERTQAKLIKKQSCDSLDKGTDSLLETEAYGLDKNNALILFGCSMAAYQGTSLVFVVPRTGNGQPEPASLPSPVLIEGDTGDEGSIVTNPDFDVATGTFTDFYKGMGLAYCGASHEWRWDGHHFVLMRMTFQLGCGGSMSGDWPVLYRSKVQQREQRTE
ncbi:DUF1176 domain-containing protein [Novacetimonas sp. GS1]|uniref:DUF1176 domain-containing protein n=1 Tax=Novacetimonas sp. GS1 TaxID=3119990 RepID=UPI002FCCFCD1